MFKVIVWREAEGGSHKVKEKVRIGGRGSLFMEDLTPQIFYQNYIPISDFFDLKIVL